MGIAQIALDPPSVKRANVEKSAPNHPSKPYTHPPLTDNTHMETTHFKKELPILTEVLHICKIEEYNEKRHVRLDPDFEALPPPLPLPPSPLRAMPTFVTMAMN